MLAIQLLGPPQIYLDQRAINVSRRRSRALIYYLAAATAPVSREHLLALFWPDHDRSAAQQILRTTLHSLRKSLGPVLLTVDESVGLLPTVDVDVRHLEVALAQPTPDRAALAAIPDLYRGDFLADFALPDCTQFEDWMIAGREHYRQLAVRGLTILAQQYEASQDFAAALAALTRALAFDPLQEDLQRVCMRLHYLAGDRVGAIRRYEQFRKLLDDEMGVPPMAETRTLYDAIVTDTLERNKLLGWNGDRVVAVGSRPSSLSPRRLLAPSPVLPFTGRDEELQRIAAVVGDHHLALITGEPGIGKSRLAEECIQAHNGLALVGVARELEQALPYQPVISALRGLLAQPNWPALRANLNLPSLWMSEVARLLPELAVDLPSNTRADLPADESRLWEGLAQFLLAVARQRPLILFLDDLHWADTATLALLGYLVRQASHGPIGFLAATRPVAARAPLHSMAQALARESRLEWITLTRLKPSATLELARHLSPTYAYPLAEWLNRNAEGNPYILAELVRYAREQQILTANAVLNLTALSADPVVPSKVYSLIQSRLARLSEAARRVLDAAVAAGREFEFEVVARAAALSEAAALDALDELRAALLIHPTDNGRFAFDHTLTMEVAYREVGEPRHRLLHRRVAEALEQIYRHQLDAFAGLIASHFAEGNAPERAAHYALRAGQQAARLAAWKEAIAFYNQALAGAPEAQRANILMALGDAYWQAGESAPAAETFTSLLAIIQHEPAAPGPDPDAVRLALAHSLLHQARYAEAIALAQQVRNRGNTQHVVDAEFIWGTALSLEGADLAMATAHLQQAEALLCSCASAPDLSRLAQIRFELGSIAAQQGDLELAIARYRNALATAEASGVETAAPWIILAHNNLAYHLHLQGDPTAADHAALGMRLAQERGVFGLQPYLLSTLGEIALAVGDLDQAEDYFQRGLELAERLAIPERIAGLTANLGLVALQRNEHSLALHRLSSALARADTLGTRHLAAQVRIWLAPLLPLAEARHYLAEARAIAENGGRRRLLAAIDQLASTFADG